MLEVDGTLDRVRGDFDPLKTPYEVVRQPSPAHGTNEEQYKRLPAYALLAPSSQNAKPWKFKIDDRDIAVYADYASPLQIAGPNNRELLTGVGAAVMNLRIAAQHFGFDVHVKRA